MARRQSRAAGQADKTLNERSNSNIKLAVTGDDGRDVTPKSLFTGIPHDRASQIQLEENSSSIDFRSMASFFQTGMGTQAISLFGQSILGSQSKSMMKSGVGQSMMGSQMSSMVSDHSEKPSSTTHVATPEMETQHKHEKLTQAELEREVKIVLEETDTITTFKLFGQAAQEETENIEAIKEQNDAYSILCANKEGNDKYVENGMQTFNNKQKDKQTLTSAVVKSHQSSQASKSILWDAHNDIQEETVETVESLEELGALPVNQSTSATSAEKSATITTTTTTTSALGKSSSKSSSRLVKRTENADEDEQDVYHKQVLGSAELKRALMLHERIISQNNYQRKIAQFRAMDQLDRVSGRIVADDDDNEMKLAKLWSFQSNVTKSMAVTQVAWNKVNPDIIAVSYGQIKGNKLKAQEDQAGLVCCWNLKNLDYPERVYHTRSSALSVSFSQMSPNLLAVGMYNGVILIYNVARESATVAIDSYDTPGKHGGPVWSLEWVERERGGDERGEVLMSVSHDGRVVQWTMRKGFESLDLMKIKRQVTSGKTQQKTNKTEHARISAFSPTLGFDFHPSDGNTYIVGTEEGTINRCSCSYNEQVLDVYKGHGGPVFCVKWHPTIDAMFASCSEDWTIRIWCQKEAKHVIRLDHGTKPIRDLRWSKYSPNLLVAISESSIDIWDLTVSILDPIMTMPFHAGCELNVIGIAPNSNCLFVGDSDGIVSVYQIKGFNTDDKQNLIELIDATLNSHDV